MDGASLLFCKPKCPYSVFLKSVDKRVADLAKEWNELVVAIHIDLMKAFDKASRLGQPQVIEDETANCELEKGEREREFCENTCLEQIGRSHLMTMITTCFSKIDLCRVAVDTRECTEYSVHVRLWERLVSPLDVARWMDGSSLLELGRGQGSMNPAAFRGFWTDLTPQRCI